MDVPVTASVPIIDSYVLTDKAHTDGYSYTHGDHWEIYFISNSFKRNIKKSKSVMCCKENWHENNLNPEAHIFQEKINN